MKHTVLSFIFLFVINVNYGQNNKQPSNIDEAIEFITTSVEDSIIQKTKLLSEEDFIELCEDWNSKYHEIISDWLYGNDKKSKIEKYYSKLGINYVGNIELIVYISLYRSLNNRDIEHKQLVKKYVKIEKKWEEEDKIRYSTDSLRGVYIPKDLEDCFKQIDSFWNDTVKNEVRSMTSSEFGGNTHFGIGLWMRNNWQLWGGSRLSKYMNDLGIYHPDSMSGTILSLYYKYLTEEKFDLEKEIDKIKEQRSKVPNKK